MPRSYKVWSFELWATARTLIVHTGRQKSWLVPTRNARATEETPTLLPHTTTVQPDSLSSGRDRCVLGGVPVRVLVSPL